MEEQIVEQTIFQGGYSFVTPFVLVYGTLREGGGLQGSILPYGQYVGKKRLKGWKLLRKEKVSFPFAVYTGDSNDSIVVDVVELDKDQKYIKYYEAHYVLDTIENNLYTPVLVEMLWKDKITYAKIYHANGVDDTFYPIANGNFMPKKDSIDFLTAKTIVNA